MAAVSCALALLGGVVGAGFASGREIMRFFAGHGRAAYASVALAMLCLATLFGRLPVQLERANAQTLAALCRARLGQRFGSLCAALFLLLCAITGGAMLAACAELGALVLPVRHAYGASLLFTLLLALCLAARGLRGLALCGAALCALLPWLLVRLLTLPAGEACFLPAMAPDLPVRASLDGAVYGALNAAMLAGSLPLLLALDRRTRRRAVWIFALLFGALLSLGTAVCQRHMSAIWNQPLPLVVLSRSLGGGGYLLVAACMYAAALSTLLSMLTGVRLLLPQKGSLLLSGALCLLFARVGFGPLVSHGYPVLGALCAGLLVVLCAGASGLPSGPS